MGGRSQKKSEQTNWDHTKALIYNALREMSPENIQHLTRIFLPMIQSGQAMASQTALHGLQRNLAHTGLMGSKIGQSQQLGFQAAMSNQALQQAFQQAFGMAGQRAGIWQNQPVPQAQPNLHMTQGIQQGIQQGLLAQALSQGNKNTPVPSPFSTGANWGLPPTYNYGTLG